MYLTNVSSKNAEHLVFVSNKQHLLYNNSFMITDLLNRSLEFFLVAMYDFNV